MKIIIKKFSWWLVMPFFSLVFLVGCKSREKAVQKTETQSEKKSDATYHIEDKTFEIVLDKSKIFKDFSYKNSSEESSKQEKKNVDKGKEYYENGNLKKEWERDLSEFSESTKKVFTELEEKINSEKETSKYWENSSNHYYQLLEEEKSKSKSYQMQLKAKPTFTWQWFFSGILIGWIALPPFFRWLWGWIKRFQPWIKFLEWVKNLKK